MRYRPSMIVPGIKRTDSVAGSDALIGDPTLTPLRVRAEVVTARGSAQNGQYRRLSGASEPHCGQRMMQPS